MNHQERLELLSALVRSGVTHFKAHDLEISLSPAAAAVLAPPKAGAVADAIVPAQPIDDGATEKLKELIETIRLDDASLLDKIFPAGAGG